MPPWVASGHVRSLAPGAATGFGHAPRLKPTEKDRILRLPALALLRNEPFDLRLLDVTLPGNERLRGAADAEASSGARPWELLIEVASLRHTLGLLRRVDELRAGPRAHVRPIVAPVGELELRSIPIPRRLSGLPELKMNLAAGLASNAGQPLGREGGHIESRMLGGTPFHVGDQQCLRAQFLEGVVGVLV